jgi:hypothetical protein
VHVGDYVWQRGPGEKFEAALGVADAASGRWGEEAKKKMEGVH